MGEETQKPNHHERREPGLGNPRWARYHNMVSAGELWNPDAVARALAILRTKQATQANAERPLERRESDE